MCVVLRNVGNVRTSQYILPGLSVLLGAWDPNRANHLDCDVNCLVIMFVFKPLFYLIMAPDARIVTGNSNNPKRSHKILFIKCKSVSSQLTKGKKNHMLKFLKPMLRMNPLSVNL